ncbi:MAG: penicillin-binding protein 2 [Thermoleophilia bacterium]|nr:penicillin-binding protein 2 [Thermoleophilia bacterium]
MRSIRANHRILFLLAVVVCVFAAALTRAVWLQVVDADVYKAMALKQHSERIVIPPTRGTIFDRTGEPLAIGERAITVVADPKMVADPILVAKQAEALLGVDADSLYERLRDTSNRFTYVLRQADEGKALAFKELGLLGVNFYPEERRSYPQGRVASQVIGLVGVDNEGLEGLERALEAKLAGTPGFEDVIRDPGGRPIDVVRSKPEQPGTSVNLTIDHQIQSSAEAEVLEAMRRWQAKGATAIVMDPRSGAILAMANAPTFNPNRVSDSTVDARRNRAVTDIYEPGSTFKIVTIAAALEEGIVTPKTRFTLAPTIRVGSHTIREAHARPTQRMTVRDILSRSSNVGTITVGLKLGRGNVAAWVERFGFGRRTGIDYPGESAGMVLPLEQWSDSTLGTVPIGQGIAVTAIQMASAYAAIGNGGVMAHPHLVESIGGASGEPSAGRRVVSRKTAAQMMAMFTSAVMDGTGGEAAIPGYTVAGKTGTAQKPEKGGYATGKYVASFVGLVPATKPRFVILVMVDEPRGEIYGGVVAAPVFRDIARFVLQYLEVPPDAPETVDGSLVVAALAATAAE